MYCKRIFTSSSYPSIFHQAININVQIVYTGEKTARFASIYIYFNNDKEILHENCQFEFIIAEGAMLSPVLLANVGKLVYRS